MRRVSIYFLPIALLLLFTEVLSACGEEQQERVFMFKFLPGDDMFYRPLEDNNSQLDSLYAYVDECRADIVSGEVHISVASYCASMSTYKENIDVAFFRANRVKSELIETKGLLEEYFVTSNHTTAYRDSDGNLHRDMVVVTLHIPSNIEKNEPEAKPVIKPTINAKPESDVEYDPAYDPQSDFKSDPKSELNSDSSAASESDNGSLILPKYSLSVRTNLFYDVLLVPTLGAEFRIDDRYGIKLDGSYSYRGAGKGGSTQKVLLISPELRWYIGSHRRFYAGVSGNFGSYNIYKGMIGGMFSKDRGYQGKLRSAGLTAGYRLHLPYGFSLDFNIGLGYNWLNYDEFTVTDGVRVYVEQYKSKGLFGPTQAGVNLVWTIGKYKK